MTRGETCELAGLYSVWQDLECLLVHGWCLVICDVEVGDGDVVEVLDYDNDIVAGSEGSAWRGHGFL